MMMRLSELLKNVSVIPEGLDRDVVGLTLDSRCVFKGDVFLAIKGTQMDGCKFASEAVSRGATAILIDSTTDVSTLNIAHSIPVIAIPHLQQHIPILAARYYGEPVNKLKLIGVTGTSGKTSCTHFIAEVLHSQHISCGIVGTLGSGLYGHLVETGLTTPDAVTLQKTFYEFVQTGAQHVAMEVSSHSIDQGRINDLPFEIGIFTNLTQDHLDYHSTMQAYADVKFRFLNEFPVKHLVINVDDRYGALWVKRLGKDRSVYTFSTDASYQANTNHIYCENVILDLRGIQATVHTPWGSGQMALPLVGQFNLSNALAALIALCLSGLSLATVLAAMKQIRPVPGRMQSLGGNGKPVVVVDYSHKPDALEKVLQALRHHTQGKLICVFGCGGDRDAGKRPLMAKIAENLADRVIVTNDNPRHEAPDAILHDIMQGFVHPELVQIELDRAKAIQKGIQSAAANDCVLIAGKGAEHYQQIGDQKLPFDDVTSAEKWLEQVKITSGER